VFFGDEGRRSKSDGFRAKRLNVDPDSLVGAEEFSLKDHITRSHGKTRVVRQIPGPSSARSTARQTLLGARLPVLVRLEAGSHGGHSRDRGPLASRRLPPVLASDLQGEAASGKEEAVQGEVPHMAPTLGFAIRMRITSVTLKLSTTTHTSWARRCRPAEGLLGFGCLGKGV